MDLALVVVRVQKERPGRDYRVGNRGTDWQMGKSGLGEDLGHRRSRLVVRLVLGDMGVHRCGFDVPMAE
jgi:hypothetical protein